MNNQDERRDVRAVVRTYFDKETQKDKNVYQTVGTAWVSPHESTITVQIETLPISKDWNGKLFINKPYEKKEDTGKFDNDIKVVEEIGNVKKDDRDVIIDDINDKPIDINIPF